MLVDDEIDILNLLEAVLRKENFTNIYKANCGQEAIEMVEKLNPILSSWISCCRTLTAFRSAKAAGDNLCTHYLLSARDEDIDKL